MTKQQQQLSIEPGTSCPAIQCSNHKGTHKQGHTHKGACTHTRATHRAHTHASTHVYACAHTHSTHIMSMLICIGIYVKFSHDEYRVKESDGFVVIKAIVSGYRRFPLQVVARSFVPTRLNLPAGQLMLKNA